MASLSLRALEEAERTRVTLETLVLLLGGTAAATSTCRRKRAVFHHVLGYTVGLRKEGRR
ncbi:hypothetical protein [Streptosporangium sp. NPDC000396]|uniref:hypothetical protein n=1 Tax=Streptosporangium sp. NPDC000396 TaxID=3366185 RepID=UPI003684D43E